MMKPIMLLAFLAILGVAVFCSTAFAQVSHTDTPAVSAAREACAARLPSDRLSLNLRDANVKSTLRLLAQQYRVSMVISDDVTGTVTVDFFRTPVSEAFLTILDSAKLSCFVAGDVLRVSAMPSTRASVSDAKAPVPDVTDQGEVLVASAGTKVIVWKGQAEMETGKRSLGWLSRNEPAPSEAASLIACIVPSGTRIATGRLSGSYGWKAVVIEGDAKGCQGTVGPQDFKTAREFAAWQTEKKRSDCGPKIDGWLGKHQPGDKVSDQDLVRAVGQACSDLLRAELSARARQLEQEKPPKPLTEAEQRQAIEYCHDMVLIYLKAPGSARWVESTYIPKSGEIIGHVDSQNSYGALLRSLYVCKLDGVVTKSARVFGQ